jgi:uroporphyrinogen-III synthase
MMQCIITRAAHQSIELEKKLQQVGCDTVLWPCVEIEADVNNPDFQAAIKQLHACDIAIFLSANAAHMSMSHWPKQFIVAQQPTCLAIGPATAKQLQNFHRTVAAIAQPPSSEGLLGLDCLSSPSVRNKQITLFCGYDPKPLLPTVLTKRGAFVRFAYCYRRACPLPLSASALASAHPQAIIISTSLALLKNLMMVVPANNQHALLERPLIVVSESMQAYAQTQGFKKIYRADNATDGAIVSLVKSLEP